MKSKLELTSKKYKQHLVNPLVEIKYFFESYNELGAPTALNPLNGKRVNIIKLLEPMGKIWVVAIGFLLFVASLYGVFHILKSSETSLIIAIATCLSALASTAILLPALALHFIHKIKHDHAKDQARFVAQGMRKIYRPDLTKVTDELLMVLFADDSPLIVEAFLLLRNLEKDVTNEDIVNILNHIFSGDLSELLHLVIDEDVFIQSQDHFRRILDEGIGISRESTFIEDPKIIQLLIYSIVIKLLTNPNADGNFVEDLRKIDAEKLHHSYEEFCEKFLHYCKNEYDFETYVDEVEGRIMSCVVDLI